jgi:1,4-alpha-glucan branching enzyme
MLDFLRFTQDLIRLRRNQPAIRSTSIRVFHVDNDHRILAFHRWLEGEGQGHDIVVVASLNDQAFYSEAIRSDRVVIVPTDPGARPESRQSDGGVPL